MRCVQFNPANLTGNQRTWWDKWQLQAAAATDKVITQWETWLQEWLKKRDPERRFTCDFNDKIWTDLKKWMLANLFHRHCAYCETSTEGFWGDMEHHRPKGSVTGRDAEGDSTMSHAVIEIGVEQIQIVHPGYFWLAYNWRNLIPSCQWCNEGGGKVDQYPADKIHVVMKRLDNSAVAALQQSAIRSKNWPTSYYLDPSDLDSHESPFLLNPLNPESAREPLKHLRFGILGQIAAVEGSRIGIETIRVLGLGDEVRNQSRGRAQRHLLREYFLKSADPDSTKADLANVLQPFLDGKEAYSVAALEYIKLQVAKAASFFPSPSP